MADKDKLRELADDLRESLVDAEAAAEAITRSITAARVALAELDGVLGGGEKRDRDPGARQRLALQVIYDAGGHFGGDQWASREGIRRAAETLLRSAGSEANPATLAKAARDLPAKYVERQGEVRRLTKDGEYWRTRQD